MNSSWVLVKQSSNHKGQNERYYDFLGKSCGFKMNTGGKYDPWLLEISGFERGGNKGGKCFV
jgi:hypothetical protein